MEKVCGTTRRIGFLQYFFVAFLQLAYEWVLVAYSSTRKKEETVTRNHPIPPRVADRPSPGSQILHYLASYNMFKREDDHGKRQLSTSLIGVTVHFLSSCSLTACNDTIFIHQGVSLKDKREFLVEKYAFSCRDCISVDASAILTSHMVLYGFMIRVYIFEIQYVAPKRFKE
jgi:hypothetical protein